MLKLNYTDYGPFLEQVTASVDAVATQRAMLAVHVGETFHLEHGWAAFLLPIGLPGITRLKSMLKTNITDAISLATVDDEFVEISFKGIWMANSANAESGTFMATLAPKGEILLYQLWQATQPQTVYFI